MCKDGNSRLLVSEMKGKLLSQQESKSWKRNYVESKDVSHVNMRI